MSQVTFLSKRLGFICLCLFSAIIQAKTVQDSVLSEQIASTEKINAEMIGLVQHDAQMPLAEQLTKQQNLAKQQADQINQHNLENNAASEYEIQKKIDHSQGLEQPRKVHIPHKNIPKPENIIFDTEVNLHINGNIKGSGTATVSSEK